MTEKSVVEELSELLSSEGLPPLPPPTLEKFSAFYDLFVRWNGRTNLSAIRDRVGILRRHFVESIACAQFLPAGIATLLDFGSGGGFPGIPIALCRPEIAVTLAESQGKKAAFLQEAVRVLGLSAHVHAGRAELLSQRFDCVTMRAVDHMESAVKLASTLVSTDGYLALMTTRGEHTALLESVSASFEALPLVQVSKDADSTDRILAVARKM